MIHYVLMPRLGANIDEGTVVGWFKGEGDTVAKAEPLVAIETEKASFELEAEESGVLRHIACQPGEKVAYNMPLAIIAGRDDEVSAEIEKISKRTEADSLARVRTMDESVFDARNAAAVPPTAGAAPQNRPPATPNAMRLAEQNGIAAAAVAALARAAPRGIVTARLLRDYLSSPPAYIYGASTGAKQILEIIDSGVPLRVIGLVDDNPDLHGRAVRGLPVIGGIDSLADRLAEGPAAVIVASHSTNRRRIFRKIAERLDEVALPAVVDRRATLLSDVSIGDGALIETGCILGHEVSIGDGAILNIGVKLSHNCVVGPYSHLAIGVSVSGAVSIGSNCFIGAGAAINPAVTIGENVIVTPGSAVTNDVPADVTVSGNPARIIGTSKRGDP